MPIAFDRRVIRKLREDRGWNLSETAARIGMSQQNLGYIERGLVSPKASTVARLAEAFGVGVETFYTRRVQKPAGAA